MINTSDEGKETEGVKKEFDNLNDLLNWNRKFLIIGGLWPMDSTYIRANILTFYLVVHLFTEYAELFSVVGDIEAMVLSALESAMQTMVLSKLIAFRHSRMIRKLIDSMREDFNEDCYANLKEKKIYLKYNYLSKLYYKISVPYILCTASLYYLRPLLISCLTGTFGANDSYILPFRTKIFFSVEDTQTYLVLYAWYFPMIYLLACHNAWICVLITIILHICGQLAIVEYRIRNIAFSSVQNENEIFKSLVERHGKFVWMANSFDNSFHFVLLIDLVCSTILVGLMSYIIVTGFEVLDTSFTYVYIIAIIATLFLLYGYCIVGERLSEESNKVHSAFYECGWYKNSIKFQKSLSICMIQTQKPLTMTAGKFFIFSLSGYTDILKSAMGYLSMLRKVSM